MQSHGTTSCSSTCTAVVLNPCNCEVLVLLLLSAIPAVTVRTTINFSPDSSRSGVRPFIPEALSPKTRNCVMHCQQLVGRLGRWFSWSSPVYSELNCVCVCQCVTIRFGVCCLGFWNWGFRFHFSSREVETRTNQQQSAYHVYRSCLMFPEKPNGTSPRSLLVVSKRSQRQNKPPCLEDLQVP